jgi:hypothetical protein
MTDYLDFGFHLKFACLREAAMAKAGILKFDILILSGHVKNPFLATDLGAETAVHTGQPIDLDSAVLSSYQGGALESFETVPATDTGTHRRHIDR